MPERTKIATCSYCGARSMLVPTAREGHELACASCGAPIHELKWLKSPSPKAKKSKPSPSNGGYRQNKHDQRSYTRRKKKRKPTWKKALEEAFDLVEDIFD
ncbi:MAG: hypothetical protein AAGA38_12690 [Pseudomonadota bacterium]